MCGKHLGNISDRDELIDAERQIERQREREMCVYARECGEQETA